MKFVGELGVQRVVESEEEAEGAEDGVEDARDVVEYNRHDESHRHLGCQHDRVLVELVGHKQADVHLQRGEDVAAVYMRAPRIGASPSAVAAAADAKAARRRRSAPSR